MRTNPGRVSCLQILRCSRGSEETGRTEADRLPEVGHKVKGIALVVQRGEARRGELAAAEQVVQEGPRGAGAGRAAALRVERQRIVLEAGVLDLERPLAGEEHAMAGVARRQ